MDIQSLSLSVVRQAHYMTCEKECTGPMHVHSLSLLTNNQNFYFYFLYGLMHNSLPKISSYQASTLSLSTYKQASENSKDEGATSQILQLLGLTCFVCLDLLWSLLIHGLIFLVTSHDLIYSHHSYIVEEMHAHVKTRHFLKNISKFNNQILNISVRNTYSVILTRHMIDSITNKYVPQVHQVSSQDCRQSQVHKLMQNLIRLQVTKSTHVQIVKDTINRYFSCHT